MKLNRLTGISLMICLISVCSWIMIPSAVPFTMQTFAVFSALLILGGKDGTIAITLYVLLGTVGIPVFSGFQAGLGHILGPTGGYIIGFILTGLCYAGFEPLLKKHKHLDFAVLVPGLILCYVAGTIWFRTVYGLRGTEYSFGAVVSICVIPYIIPDILKLFLAVRVCRAVGKAKD